MEESLNILPCSFSLSPPKKRKRRGKRKWNTASYRKVYSAIYDRSWRNDSSNVSLLPLFFLPSPSLPLPFLSNVQLEFTAESSIAERQAECRLDRKWFVLSEKCGVTHNLTHRFSNRACPTNAVFIFIYAVDQLLQYTISAVITYSSRVSLARGSIMAGGMRAEPRLRIRKENWNPNVRGKGRVFTNLLFFFYSLRWFAMYFLIYKSN